MDLEHWGLGGGGQIHVEKGAKKMSAHVRNLIDGWIWSIGVWACPNPRGELSTHTCSRTCSSVGRATARNPEVRSSTPRGVFAKLSILCISNSLFSMIGASGSQQSLEDTCMPLLEDFSPHCPQQENQSPGQAHS